MSRDPFYVSINAIVVKENKILLGKRRSDFGDGLWAIPGGHLEYNESMKDGVARELLEETGLVCNSFVFSNIVVDPDSKNGRHYVHFGFVAQEVKGEPSLKEPDKCSEWKWFDLKSLPENMVPGLKIQIGAYLEKKIFTDF